MPQPAEARGDIEADVLAWTAAREPWPQAFAELLLRRACASALADSSSKRLPSNSRPTFLRDWLSVFAWRTHGVSSSITRLELLIFLQRAVERLRVFPKIENPPDFRIRAGDVPGERVRVKTIEDLLTALVRKLHQVRQRHHRIPRRLRCHLHGERLVAQSVRLPESSSFLNSKLLRRLAADRQRQRFGDEYPPPQHGQNVLPRRR